MLDFGVSETVAILPLTTYVLGLAFGPMIAAPMSETLGRLGTYRIAVPISALFSLGAGFAPNMAGLCILRFLAGFFGGAPLPVTAGTGADLFDGKDFAFVGTLFLFTPFLGKDKSPASVLATDSNSFFCRAGHRTRSRGIRDTKQRMALVTICTRNHCWSRLYTSAWT